MNRLTAAQVLADVANVVLARHAAESYMRQSEIIQDHDPGDEHHDPPARVPPLHLMYAAAGLVLLGDALRRGKP